MQAEIWIYFKEAGLPSFHGSIDGQEWLTIPMEYHGRNLYLLKLGFAASLRFVFCDQQKTKWYNPHKELSNPSTFIIQNQSSNFVITEGGTYIMANSILSVVRPHQSLMYQLIVINIDGVLVGDELSLYFFNVLWMSRFYMNKRITLVYSTGRSLEDVLKLQNIILPQFLICEGGSYLYQINNQGPHQKFYQLLAQSVLSEQQMQRLVGLEKYGFRKANQNRGNSYVISKQELIIQNQSINKFLQTLDFQYNMVQETEVVYFDFSPPGVNKYTALLAIQQMRKVQRTTIFGSNLNDFKMMMNADVCIVPINANKRLKLLLRGYKKLVESRGEFAEALIEYFQQMG